VKILTREPNRDVFTKKYQFFSGKGHNLSPV